MHMRNGGWQRADRHECKVSGELTRVELTCNLSVLQQLRDSVADRKNPAYFCLWICTHHGERKQRYPQTQLRFPRILISILEHTGAYIYG